MRRTAWFAVAMLTLAAFTSLGPAAQAAGPKEPFVIGWGEMWTEPITVPPGTHLLFSFGWGFASEETGMTVPADYLGQLLDEGYKLKIRLDGRRLPITTRVEEADGVCGWTPEGEEICQDATFVIWEYLSRPLHSGSHRVSFELELLKDYPNDGWGWSYYAGDTLETDNTIVVG